jgi:hypothetical protein
MGIFPTDFYAIPARLLAQLHRLQVSTKHSLHPGRQDARRNAANAIFDYLTFLHFS